MITMTMIGFATTLLCTIAVATEAKAAALSSINEHELLASATSIGSASSIPAASESGNRLLSKAKQQQQHLPTFRRRLNNDDDEIDYSWVRDYSIKFESCHTIQEFRADGSNSEDEDASPVEMKRLVQFKLCPTDNDYEFASQYEYTTSCGKCRNGAEYLVEMREFLEAFLDFHMSEKEYNCERVKENCDCDNNDDDYSCLADCYASANLDYCDEFESNDGDDDYEFDIDEYLECENVVDDNGGGDDYYGQQQSLYVGAYCSDNGKAIYLGEFQDRQCTTAADPGSYYALFQHELPFQDTSIVNRDECLSCLEPPENDDDNANNNNNNNNGGDDDEVRELCEELYERSAKCEENLSDGVAAAKYTGACEYIHKTLPKMEKVVGGGGGGFSSSKFFASVFFVSTLLAVAYAVHLHVKMRNNNTSSEKVDLSSRDGEVA